MKNLIKFILIFLILLPLISFSQNNDKIDKEFQTFWEQFKTAIVKGDKLKVSSMTSFPFNKNDKIYNKKLFSKEFNKIFSKIDKEIISNRSGEYQEISLNTIRYVFESDYTAVYNFKKIENTYKFIKFETWVMD